jgi:hypothetical protein
MLGSFIKICQHIPIFVWSWTKIRRESISRSQMDVKRKTCDIQTWKKSFISCHILHQHWYTCSIALPVRWNPQRRSHLTVVSANSAPGWALLSQPIPHLVGHHLRLWNVLEFLYPVVNRFMQQTLSTVNRKHFFINILCTESPCPQKMHNRQVLSGCTLLKHSRHFDYWNQLLNMDMCICYLDCHEAGLCCYLLILIENLLHPLQLFYFHLWPVYWLCLVIETSHEDIHFCACLERNTLNICWNEKCFERRL